MSRVSSSSTSCDICKQLFLGVRVHPEDELVNIQG